MIQTFSSWILVGHASADTLKMTSKNLIITICIALFIGLFVYNKKQEDPFLTFTNSSTNQNIKQMSAVSDALAMMTSIKIYMAEFYLMKDKYPRDNLELGIDPPDKFATNQIQNLKVTQAGEIIVHFKPWNKQKNKQEEVFPTIRLSADNSLENSGLLRWNCTTEHISDSVLKILPTCSQYTPDQNPQKLEQEQVVVESGKPSEEPAATITKTKEPQKGYLAYDLARHIKNGENKLIEKMLAEGVHFDGEPLLAAVEANRFDLVHQFLSKGANANSLDRDGYSLLQSAIFNSAAYQREDLDIIRLLLNSGASTAYVSPSNQTALLSLHIPNQLKYIKPNDNVTEEEKNKNITDLQLSYEIAKLLLSHEAKVTVTDATGHSPLARAVWAGADNLVELFLQRGANADSWDGKQKYLLDIALKKGYPKTALLLFRSGALLDRSSIKDKNERLLILALQQKDEAIIQEMITTGADPAKKIRLSNSGIVSAIKTTLIKQDWKNALRFVKQGAKLPYQITLDDPDYAKRWPEQVTRKNQLSLSSIKYILEVGGSQQLQKFLPHIDQINAYSVQRETLLQYVINNDHTELVLPLIHAGANTDVVDKDNRSLLEISIANDDEASALTFLKFQDLPKDADHLRSIWQLAYDHDMKMISDQIGKKLQTYDPPEIPKTISKPDQKNITLWKISCDSESKGWFGLVAEGDKEQLIIGAGSKTIPYPGFWKPVDVYSDIRFKWINAYELQLKNFDKNAGWKDFKTFYNCNKNESGLDLTGSWQIPDLKKGNTIITFNQNGHGLITTDDKTVATINAVEPAYRGVKVTFNMCELDRDIVIYIKSDQATGDAHMYREKEVRRKVKLQRLETDIADISATVPNEPQQASCP